MSKHYHNPEQKPAPYLAPDTAIRPDAPDFIEQPDVTPGAPPERESLPLWLYIVCGFALFLAGSSYVGIHFGEGYYDEGAGAAVAASGPVGPPPEDNSPMSLGKKLYAGNCANCHQASGAGQPGAYPPMVGSEWVLGSKEMFAAILLDGVAGPLSVHGGEYGTNVMPAWANLSNENLADIMTYVRASWGNSADAVKPEDVAAVRAKDASRTQPWAQADLEKMKNTK
jgi:mono/diheme cytochrome c family protein